ncbi:MAG: leucine-rich repeat domain-containing protein, partial [Bacteroidetes bacterium]|nr:leucine-rich repeat domain-containing protein [Bacteroidota bacterium]
MKRFVTMIIAGLLLTGVLFSQGIQYYTWEQSSLSYDKPAGTVQTLSNPDDGYVGIKLPFNFVYLGVPYDSIYVGSNGFATFGNSANTSGTNNDDLFTSGAANRVLAPWWDDLSVAGGNVITAVTGTSPNRVYIVRWDSVLSYFDDSGNIRLNFAIRLQETSNIIEFHYGLRGPGNENVSTSASIGISDETGGTDHFVDGTTGSRTVGVSTLRPTSDFPASGTIIRFRPLNTGERRDYDALTAFYNALNGPNWPNQANWLSSAPFSQWYGVQVEGISGRVNNINLYNDSLAGVIPNEFGQLDSLRYFFAGYNRMRGSLPDSLYNLSELRQFNAYGQTYIDYQNGGFTGSISTRIGELTKLTELVLSNSKLTGPIPSEIGNLQSLQTLYLQDNQLTGIPPASIAAMSGLRYLNLGSNTFDPHTLTMYMGMTQLWNLTLHNMNLTGQIPTSIGNLTGLTDLNLADNNLSGPIPQELWRLTNLGSLFLNHQPFTSGALSDSIGNLTNLYNLGLEGDSLTGELPPSFFNLTNLQYVYLGNNYLVGPLDSLSKLTQLRGIWIYNNSFSNLPDFSGLSNFYYLAIEGNQFDFSDIIPNIGVPIYTFTYSPQDPIGVSSDTTLGSGESLTLTVAGLNVGGSANTYQWTKNGVDINGATSINFTIASATASDAGAYRCNISDANVPNLALRTRAMSVNVISPPASARDSLALVDLYNSLNGPNWPNQSNWLSGPVNTWYGVNVMDYGSELRVTSLNLSDDSLAGQLPVSIGNLDSLTFLDLGYNRITGQIPDTLFHLKNLTNLRFQGQYWDNQTYGLSGTISRRIGELTKLKSLILENGYLTGSVPEELGQLTQLEEILLWGNQLDSLPDIFTNLTMLRTFRVDGNQFKGPVPPSLVNCPLEEVNLSYNQFTGAFPAFLYDKTTLTGLYLSYNRFMPSMLPAAGSIVPLTQLQSLDLSGDSLIGTISDELLNWTNLSYVRLYDNQLSGSIPSGLTGLTNLYYLDLGNNQLTGTVPAFTRGFSYYFFGNNLLDSVPSFNFTNTVWYIDIQNNRLTFDDIKPNLGKANNYSYAPQDSVGLSENRSVIPGTSFE